MESAGKSSSGSEDGSGSASRRARAAAPRTGSPAGAAKKGVAADASLGLFFCGRGAAARAPRFLVAATRTSTAPAATAARSAGSVAGATRSIFFP